MKLGILLSLCAFCFVATAQEAKIKTVTQPTGRDQLISVGNCSSAVSGISTGIYNSSFTKLVCREYETFQANVEGSFWNSKTTRTSESTLSYRIEQQTVTKSNYQFSNVDTGNQSADIILTAVEAALLAADAVNQCNSARNLLYPLIVNLNSTKCAN
jgi:hypothetical protein